MSCLVSSNIQSSINSTFGLCNTSAHDIITKINYQTNIIKNE